MPSTCLTLLSPCALAISPLLPLPCMVIARAGDLPIIVLAARGHIKRNDLFIVALPAQAVNLPCIPVAARTGDLPVLALVVRGHHKCGSLPIIALAARVHCKYGNLPLLAHTAPTTCLTLPLPRAPSICPSSYSQQPLAILSCHQLPAALLLSSPAAESFFG
jgi:hypothetical protein